GFNLSPEEAKSEVNRFNKKPDQKSDSLMLFSEHLLDKQKNRRGYYLNFLITLGRKKQTITDSCNQIVSIKMPQEGRSNSIVWYHPSGRYIQKQLTRDYSK